MLCKVISYSVSQSKIEFHKLHAEKKSCMGYNFKLYNYRLISHLISFVRLATAAVLRSGWFQVMRWRIEPLEHRF